MNTIPDTHRDLVERPIVITLVTLMPDSQPQATPVWFNFDGTYIWVNSARGRQKDLNMRARPQVTLLIIDPADPYRYMEIRGKVDQINEDGALEHIVDLCERYLDHRDFYRNNPEGANTEIRVSYRIKPDHIVPH